MCPPLPVTLLVLTLAPVPAAAITVGVTDDEGTIGGEGGAVLTGRAPDPAGPPPDALPAFGVSGLLGRDESASGFVLRNLGREGGLGPARFCGPGALAELRDVCDYITGPGDAPAFPALPPAD